MVEEAADVVEETVSLGATERSSVIVVVVVVVVGIPVSMKLSESVGATEKSSVVVEDAVSVKLSELVKAAVSVVERKFSSVEVVELGLSTGDGQSEAYVVEVIVIALSVRVVVVSSLYVAEPAYMVEVVVRPSSVVPSIVLHIDLISSLESARV